MAAQRRASTVAMPLDERSFRRFAARAAVRLAGAASVLALAVLPLRAQDAGLRGEVPENVLARDLLSRAQLADRPTALSRPPSSEATPSNAPLPDYRPASAGAVDDEDNAPEDGSLFTERAQQDDTFANPPARRARPVTGARRQEAEEPEQSARLREDATPEEADTTGTVRTATVDSLDLEAERGPLSDNPRTDAIEGRDFEPEENPYAPLGLRLGSFNVTSRLDTGLTWTSNANSAPDGGEAVLSESTLRLGGVSDWSRHAARFDAYGTFRKTIDGEPVSELQGGIDAALDLDLAHEYRGRAGLSYSVRPESASSPVVIVGAASRPTRHGLTGTLGLDKDIGKLRLGVTGTVDRVAYSDAKLSGGGTLSQEERNSTLVSGALRIGYAVSPALTPFVETEYGRRVYDLKVDSAGYQRSGDRVALRGGVELDLGEKLTGEISAGWLRESFDDPRLDAISGLTVNASLDWSPFRGTIVALDATTTVEGSTTAGDSGSILYDGSMRITREIRANLTADLLLGAAWRDYAGSSDHETTLRAETSATWWLNRYAGVTGRLRHETFNSTLPGRDSRTNSVYLGMSFQR